MNIFKKLANLFAKKPTVVKLTITEMIAYINKEYHFNMFDENLVNEIYSKLIDYGSVKVKKEAQYKYIVELSTISKTYYNNEVHTYEVTQKGLTKVIVDED